MSQSWISGDEAAMSAAKEAYGSSRPVLRAFSCLSVNSLLTQHLIASTPYGYLVEYSMGIGQAKLSLVSWLA